MTYLVHDFHPTAFYLFGTPIPWYWLAYVFGFFFVYLTSLYLIRRQLTDLTEDHLKVYMILGWVGMILGARCGYVIIYHPLYYLENPHTIPQIWMGGMSFHGALIGVSLVLLAVARQFKESFFHMADALALSVPFPLGLGRIANFIGGELAGTPSSLPWAVIFPTYDMTTPRHPSQLYQASLEGFLLFFLLWRKKQQLKHPGTTSAYFLIGYGTLRGLVEFVRLPDPQIGYLLGPFTTGHLLCLLMIILGSMILIHTLKPSSGPRTTSDCDSQP